MHLGGEEKNSKEAFGSLHFNDTSHLPNSDCGSDVSKVLGMGSTSIVKLPDSSKGKAKKRLSTSMKIVFINQNTSTSFIFFSPVAD